ncbi:DUF4097 family beta strand repeat-containing protein [Hamadaea sp. NPDC051192]|uniref:DUF4097 family beta strand repeat-containing protein n=1 Tax=Hamadaea sp. NPDC051192 TaxID=3154940 RepID=UPI00343C2F1A
MYEFPITGPLSTDVRVSAGRVEITAQPGLTTATVAVEPFDGSDLSREAAAQTTVELHGTNLIVKAPEHKGWLKMRNPRLAVSIRIPADSTLDLRTASADATCSGAYRQVSVHSASGDVFVEDVTGDFAITTASGDVRAMHVGGEFKANSASGDISADTVDGSADLHSASGDVELGTLSGGVRATTASGDFALRTLRNGVAKVNSASGDIAIGVVPGIGVWMELTSMSGRARSDLQPSDAPASGQPDVALHLRSMSGDIVVSRAAG